MNAKTQAAVQRHGEQLLAIFPHATERDPVNLCKKLRRLERRGTALGLRLCNGPKFPREGDAERESDSILAAVNFLLGNGNEYQPKTGAKCGCRRGIERDNFPTCEGTGHVIDFRAIRNRLPLVPVFVNLDPRGYSLKIDDAWMRAHDCRLYSDRGSYGIIAPNLTNE